MNRKRQSFLAAWLDDTKDIVVRRGAWAIVPWTFLCCAAAAASAAYFMPASFFPDANWGTLATVYSGLLAFNAITLALSWNAFGSVFDRLSRPEFSTFIRQSGELERYQFVVSYIHYTQVIASAVTLVALLLFLMPISVLWVDRLAFGATICFTAYALRWAVGAVHIAQDLVWNYSTFDALPPEQKKQLKIAVSNAKDP